jgi:hypothetical protein
MQTPLESAFLRGKWVPGYYGLRFKIFRLVGKSPNRPQVESIESFATLAAAQAECTRRNLHLPQSPAPSSENR